MNMKLRAELNGKKADMLQDVNITSGHGQFFPFSSLLFSLGADSQIAYNTPLNWNQ